MSIDGGSGLTRPMRWALGASVISVLLAACGGAGEANAAQARMAGIDGVNDAVVHSSRAGSPLNLEYSVSLRLPGGESVEDVTEIFAQALLIADEELRPTTAGAITFRVREADLNDEGRVVTYDLFPATEHLGIPLRDSQVSQVERGIVALSADTVEAFAQDYSGSGDADVD